MTDSEKNAILDRITIGTKEIFKDADLIGYPVRITVGKKAESEGLVEYKLRTEIECSEIPLGEVIAKVKAFLAE